MENWNTFDGTRQYTKLKQYLLFPPCASVTVLCMEFISAFIILIGILFYPSNETVFNWSREADGFQRFPNLRAKFVPQMFEWGQIETIWWPVERVNAMISEKVLT